MKNCEQSTFNKVSFKDNLSVSFKRLLSLNSQLQTFSINLKRGVKTRDNTVAIQKIWVNQQKPSLPEYMIIKGSCSSKVQLIINNYKNIIINSKIVLIVRLSKLLVSTSLINKCQTIFLSNCFLQFIVQSHSRFSRLFFRTYLTLCI